MKAIRLITGLLALGAGLLSSQANGQHPDVVKARDFIANSDYSAAAAALLGPLGANDADALMLQGVLHALGAGAIKDYPLALDFWRRAAFAGQRDAARLLFPSLNSKYAREWWSDRIAAMPEPKLSVPRSIVREERGGFRVEGGNANKWVTREAEAGNPVGLFNAYHAAKFRALQNDNAKARVRRLLERAAEMKLPAAMKELSSELKQSMPVSEFMSLGFEKDVTRAAVLMKEAADSGDMNAQLLWAHWLDSKYIETRDPVAAVAYYQKSSDQGDDHAAYFLYRAYAEGKGTEKDERKAAYFLQLAAERRNDTAVNVYGDRLFRGRGMQADQARAVAMMEESLACSLVPDEDALALVAYAYASGSGVEKDLKKAAWWARWAEERGSAYAKELLVALSAATVR